MKLFHQNVNAFVDPVITASKPPRDDSPVLLQQHRLGTSYQTWFSVSWRVEDFSREFVVWSDDDEAVFGICFQNHQPHPSFSNLRAVNHTLGLSRNSHVENANGTQFSTVPLSLVILQTRIQGVGEFTDDRNGPFVSRKMGFLYSVDDLWWREVKKKKRTSVKVLWDIVLGLGRQLTCSSTNNETTNTPIVPNHCLLKNPESVSLTAPPLPKVILLNPCATFAIVEEGSPFAL